MGGVVRGLQTGICFDLECGDNRTFYSQHLSGFKQHMTAYLHNLYYQCMQSSFTPAQAVLAYCKPDAVSLGSSSFLFHLKSLPHIHAHACSASCQCLHCALCPLPLAYYYSIPYVNTVTRTGCPRVLCSDSMASPVYRNTLTEHPTPLCCTHM